MCSVRETVAAGCQQRYHRQKQEDPLHTQKEVSTSPPSLPLYLSLSIYHLHDEVVTSSPLLCCFCFSSQAARICCRERQTRKWHCETMSYLFVFLTDFTSDHCKCLHITLRGEGTQCSCVLLSVNIAVEWSSVLSVECECHRME